MNRGTIDLAVFEDYFWGRDGGSSTGRKRVFADRSISVSFHRGIGDAIERGGTRLYYIWNPTRGSPPSKVPRFLLVGSGGAQHFAFASAGFEWNARGSRHRHRHHYRYRVAIIIGQCGRHCCLENIAFRSLSQIAGA